MKNITTAALFFLAAGIFTSVSILSVYQVLFAIPLVYFTVIAIKNKDIKLPVSAWFLLAFSVISALSLMINIDVVPKPSRNFGKIKYFLYAVGGIWVLRAWVLDLPNNFKIILFKTFCISLVVAAAISIWQIASGMDRASGLTETMRYGYGSCLALLLLLTALLHKEKLAWVDTKFGSAGLFFGFIGMYLTYTRGALLGLLAGLPFVFFFYKPRLAKIVAAVTFSMILALFLINQFGTGEYGSRFLKNKNASSDGIRRSIWIAAVIAIKEKPALGWGYSNFHSQLRRIKTEHSLSYPDYNDAHAHNLYLDVAAGTGIIGIILFLGWLVGWAFEVFKAGGLTRAFIIPFGASFVLISCFEMTLSANVASFLFFIYSMSYLPSEIYKSR